MHMRQEERLRRGVGKLVRRKSDCVGVRARKWQQEGSECTGIIWMCCVTL